MKNMIRKNVPALVLLAVISSTAVMYGMEDSQESWGQWLSSFIPTSGSSNSGVGRGRAVTKKILPSARRAQRVNDLETLIAELKERYKGQKGKLIIDESSNIQELFKHIDEKMEKYKYQNSMDIRDLNAMNQEQRDERWKDMVSILGSAEIDALTIQEKLDEISKDSSDRQ